MAEPTAISVILEPITLILSTVTTALTSIHYSWWASRLASLLALPWKLLMVPFRLVASILLVVFSPVLLVLSYVVAMGGVLWRLMASLEPLYKFFGAAAVVGIMAGLTLGVISTHITTHLGINTDPYYEDEDLYPIKKRRLQQRRYLDELDDDEYAQVWDDAVASTSDRDLPWLDPSSSSPSRRRLASGLLSQTIHEEEDDDDESDPVL